MWISSRNMRGRQGTVLWSPFLRKKRRRTVPCLPWLADESEDTSPTHSAASPAPHHSSCTRENHEQDPDQVEGCRAGTAGIGKGNPGCIPNRNGINAFSRLRIPRKRIPGKFAFRIRFFRLRRAQLRFRSHPVAQVRLSDCAGGPQRDPFPPTRKINMPDGPLYPSGTTVSSR